MRNTRNTTVAVSDSGESEEELKYTPERGSAEREASQPHSILSHRFRESKEAENRGRKSGSVESQIAVMVSGPARPWEYRKYRGDTTVESVLKELKRAKGRTEYEIEYEDGTNATKLLDTRNGQNALDLFNDKDMKSSSEDSGEPVNTRPKRARGKTPSNGFVDISKMDLDSENDDQQGSKKRRIDKGTVSRLAGNSTRQSSRFNSSRSSRNTSQAHQDDDDDESDDGSNVATHTRTRRGARSAGESSKPTRSSGRVTRSAIPRDQDDEEVDELSRDVQEASDSEIAYENEEQPKKRATRSKAKAAPPKSLKPSGKRPRRFVADESSESEQPEQPTRRSGRERVSKNMREKDLDEEVYADEVAKTNAPKVVSIREIYQPIAKNSPFKLFHNNRCDVCKIEGNNVAKGFLVHCQGCSSSIHKNCLGYRSGRKPIVTKVGHENFVMQCRRCIGLVKKEDSSAPRLDVCQTCKKPGLGCKAFSAKKTAKQEEKIREENGGDDPITEVSADLINNASNLLFRCIGCHRGFHFEHIDPSRKVKKGKSGEEDIDAFREARRKEFKDWNCTDCREYDTKISGLVAWRPANRNNYTLGQTIGDYEEDEKEYLVRWEDMSYLQCVWMPGSWVWGVTAAVMRKAFANRDEGINETPKWTTEEAIPEEFLRMEIIFDVEYDANFSPKSEAADKARIDSVKRVLVKFQGLSYDEAVWEEPPERDDEERWNCFVAAYNEYVVGVYFTRPAPQVMKKSIDAFRSRPFKVNEKKQPASLVGGKLMPYQMEGMNWMLYKFHQKKNVILADEMGLGKTIQVIGLIAALVKENAKCFPFLIVTPNSTCPNWRREIKKWAPSLRVVTFYGGRTARDMALQYELYPNESSDMRAHVVVTSYEGPVEDSSKSFFKKISWAGMIVDEGQRLKNDENLLYAALLALKTPFQVLLTGTPLQNNKRELFNLLAFLDSSINAANLEEQYEEITKHNLPELQSLIRPFFLRRTKAQVLKDLPALSQMILPVSMSVVQKKLYKMIIAKNAELMKSIFGQDTNLRPKERGNLNNILMQLRKCLCHPFTYSSAIEERGLSDAALHRNLIDASSKFQLLEIMLPKLKERGHRVLLFSQFLVQLDLVEDLLRGMELSYRRLDGTISAQEKQKRIDEFNAPDSSIFAFMLSTRSGGVGINLATADTVIIMDPDFNPQQDIQAISRAHRIGQKNKVLVFQLVTKDSAEEKIMQIGRKKIALGALIESMGGEEDEVVDVESILKHGTKALFDGDDKDDIRHDSASVDKLLDRAQVDEVDPDQEENKGSTFSLARVWAQDKGTLEEDFGDADANVNDAAPSDSVWEKILAEREEEAKREASKNVQDFGRGKRARQTVTYAGDKNGPDDDDAPGRRRSQGVPSDQEFGPNPEAPESDLDETSGDDSVDLRELQLETKTKADSSATGALPESQRASIKPGDKPSKIGKTRHFPTIPPPPKSVPSNAPYVPSNGAPSSESVYRPGSQQQKSFLPQSQPNPLNRYQPTHIQRHSFDQPPILPPSQHQGGYMQNQRPNPSAYIPSQPTQIVDRHGNALAVRAANGHTGSQPLPGPQPCYKCGLRHIGITPSCPSFSSPIEIRLMLDSLVTNKPPHPPEFVGLAKTYLEKELKRNTAIRLAQLSSRRSS